jgi:hypothetical protein
MMTENNGKDSTKVGDNYMMTEASSSNQTSTNTIRDVTEVVYSIEEKLGQTNPNYPMLSKCTIFRVPDKLRKHNEKDFEPELVSIGPFHHGKEKLLPMQEIKLQYLHRLLNRVLPTKETTLKCFVEAIEKIEQECRACYAGEIGFVKNEFIEMMVIDGCFIIEFFRKSSMVHREEEDPVFNSSLKTCQIKNDLFLLENQLPWRVLECLFSMTKSNGQEMSLSDLIPSDITGLQDPHGKPQNKHLLVGLQDPHGNLQNKHLLDCYRNKFVGSFGWGANHNNRKWPSERIPSVTELIRTGVRIKIGDENDVLNVTFESREMTIPPIRIAEDTKSLFKNMVAFEQCESTQDHKVSSYALLLRYLISTGADMNVLKRNGILKSFLSDEDTLTFFNGLGSDAAASAYGDFLYSKLYCDVQKYCRTDWHTWYYSLVRRYFDTPWALFNLYFALISLFFTISQTYISILSYQQDQNKKS